MTDGWYLLKAVGGRNIVVADLRRWRTEMSALARELPETENVVVMRRFRTRLIGTSDSLTAVYQAFAHTIEHGTRSTPSIS
jgi:hypothetical protein